MTLYWAPLWVILLHSFPLMFMVFCGPQYTLGERSMLLTAEKRKLRLRAVKTFAQASTSWDSNLGWPDSDLHLSVILHSGSISPSSNNDAYISFFGNYFSLLNLCCSGKDVSIPVSEDLTIQAKANHMFYPWFKGMTQVRFIFQFNEREQEAPLSIRTGSYKSGTSLNPQVALVEVTEASKRKLRLGGERISQMVSPKSLDPAKPEACYLWTFQLQNQ